MLPPAIDERLNASSVRETRSETHPCIDARLAAFTVVWWQPGMPLIQNFKRQPMFPMQAWGTGGTPRLQHGRLQTKEDRALDVARSTCTRLLFFYSPPPSFLR